MQSSSNVKDGIKQLQDGIDNTIKGYDKIINKINKININIDDDDINQIEKNLKSLLNDLGTSINAIDKDTNKEYTTSSIFGNQPAHQSVEQLKGFRDNLQKGYQQLKLEVKDNKQQISKEVKKALKDSLNKVKGVFSEAKKFLVSIKGAIDNFLNKPIQSTRKSIGNTDIVGELDGIAKEHAEKTSIVSKLLAVTSVLSNLTNPSLVPYVVEKLLGSKNSKEQNVDKTQDSLAKQIQVVELKISELTKKRDAINQDGEKISNDWSALLNQKAVVEKEINNCKTEIADLKKHRLLIVNLQ